MFQNTYDIDGFVASDCTVKYPFYFSLFHSFISRHSLLTIQYAEINDVNGTLCPLQQ